MIKITTKDNLFKVLDILEDLKIKYWVEGGWGVDILTGKQNRNHRDIDIDFDSSKEDVLLSKLEKIGYKIETDLRPTRIELYHPDLGYLDLHPLILNEDGTAKQVALDGSFYEFEKNWFTEVVFDGRIIPCYSYDAQKLFHSGYDLREVDYIDLKNLEDKFKNEC